MRNAVFLTLVLAFAGAAQARESIRCLYQKSDIKFDFTAVTTDSRQGAIITASGLLFAQRRDGTTILRADETFTSQSVRQYWSDGEDLRLVLFAEKFLGTDSISSISIIIRTKKSGTGRYEGTFAVFYSGLDGPWSFEDQILCQTN